MALRECNAPKSETDIAYTVSQIVKLFQNNKLYFSELFVTSQKVYGHADKPPKSMNTMIKFDADLLLPLIEEEDRFTKEKMIEIVNKIPQDKPELIDLFTFCILPTAFCFFMVNSQNELLKEFLEEVIEISPDLFIKIARVAFLMPSAVRFIKKVFRRNLIKIINISTEFIEEEVIINRIKKSWEENITMCPSVTQMIVELASKNNLDKRVFKECFIDILKKEPRLFCIGYWYKSNTDDVLEHLSEIIDIIGEQSDFFISKIRKTEICSQYEIGNEYTAYIQEIPITRVSDVFDDIFFDAIKTGKLVFNDTVYTMKRTIYDLSRSEALNPPQDVTSVTLEIASRNIRNILKHVPSLARFESLPPSIAYPFDLLQYLRKLICLGPREFIIPSLKLLNQISALNDFNTIIKNDDEAKYFTELISGMHITYDETKKFLCFVNKVKRKAKNIEVKHTNIWKQSKGMCYAIYAEKFIKPVQLSAEAVVNTPSLLFEDKGLKLISDNLPEFISEDNEEFRMYAIHKVFEVIPFSKFKDLRQDINSLEKEFSNYILENSRRLIESSVKEILKYKNKVMNLLEKGDLDRFNEKLIQISTEDRDPLQKCDDFNRIQKQYATFLSINGVSTEPDAFMPLTFLLLSYKKVPDAIYSLIYILEFHKIENEGDVMIIPPLRYLINQMYQEKGMTESNIIQKFIRSNHLNATVYVCGDNDSLAVPFLCTIFNISRMQVINGKRNLFKIIPKKVGVHSYVRVEFVRCLIRNELPDDVDRKSMIVFAACPDCWKSGFNNAKDFGKGTIYFEECDGATSDRSSVFFSKRGYTFKAITNDDFYNILDDTISAMN
jgi:hypothetical protein